MKLFFYNEKFFGEEPPKFYDESSGVLLEGEFIQPITKRLPFFI